MVIFKNSPKVKRYEGRDRKEIIRWIFQRCLNGKEKSSKESKVSTGEIMNRQCFVGNRWSMDFPYETVNSLTSEFSVPCFCVQNPKKIHTIQNPHAQVHTLLITNARTFAVKQGYLDNYIRTILKVAKQWTKYHGVTIYCYKIIPVFWNICHRGKHNQPGCLLLQGLNGELGSWAEWLPSFL